MRTLRKDESIYAALGRAVRKRRKAMRLTQAQLASLAGSAELFVRELEGGKSTVRLEKLVDVLQVLGLQLHLETGREGLKIDE